MLFRSIDGEARTVEVLLSEEQIAFWESNLKKLNENVNVEVQTMPNTDVYLTMTEAFLKIIFPSFHATFP